MTKRGRSKADPLIEIKGLFYSYPNGNQAVVGVDLEVRAGEMVALLGENGAGKTTLLKHLIGLLEQEKGIIKYRGKPVTKKNLQEVRRAIGYIFQNPDDQLFSTTVAEDVAFGPLNLGLDEKTVRKRVRRALRTVGLGHLSGRSPHELSVGEKKRTCLAGVLAMNPDVLVLDEPTANLDPKGRRQVVSLLKRLNRNEGKTVIFCTHNVNIVPELAERAVVMHKGKVLHDGTVLDLFTRNDILDRAHLEVPEAATILNILRREGVEIDPALTAEDAALKILQKIRGPRSGAGGG